MKHNPYGNVNWESEQQVKSFSHMHVIEQQLFDWAYEKGYRHFPISHYQPSKPMYPLTDYFANVPNDVLGCPNTEKVKTTNIGMNHHFNPIGSFAEGHGHEQLYATHTWEEIFDQCFEQMQFPDAGGITINHESDRDLIIKMLDYDHRVLGMEIYNDGETDETNQGYREIWDYILSTGRKCFGFCVIDWILEHKKLIGSNILLVPEFTEYECLKAYRNGAFYGMLEDTGMRFNHLTALDNRVSVGVNREATIRFITNRGIEKTVTGANAQFEVSNQTYVRVEVQEGENPYAKLFSNPFMFKSKQDFDARKRMIRNTIILS